MFGRRISYKKLKSQNNNLEIYLQNAQDIAEDATKKLKHKSMLYKAKFEDNEEQIKRLTEIINSRETECHVSPACVHCRWSIELPFWRVSKMLEEEKENAYISIPEHRCVICGKALQKICPSFEPATLETNAPPPCIPKDWPKEYLYD